MYGMISLLIGLGLTGYGLFDWLRFQRLIRQGNTTEAVIVTFREVGEDGGNWIPVLRYRVNGVEYTGAAKHSSRNEYVKDLSQAEHDPSHPYALGKKITIFYDEKRPSYFIASGEGTIRSKFMIGAGAIVLTITLLRFIFW